MHEIEKLGRLTQVIHAGQHTDEILAAAGIDDQLIHDTYLAVGGLDWIAAMHGKLARRHHFHFRHFPAIIQGHIRRFPLPTLKLRIIGYPLYIAKLLELGHQFEFLLAAIECDRIMIRLGDKFQGHRALVMICNLHHDMGYALAQRIDNHSRSRAARTV